MKTILLFLALTAPMLAQDQTIQTRNEYQTLFPAPDTSNVFQGETIRPDTLNRITNSMNRDTIWQYIAVRTPSGKVVRMDRVIEHVIDYDALKYDVAIPFNTVRDSVLTTGCPVCGSDSVVCRFVPEQIFTATPARIVWDFVEVGSSGAGYDTSRYVPAVPERVIPAHHLCGEVIGWGETRYVCASCGTVYHGRRK